MGALINEDLLLPQQQQTFADQCAHGPTLNQTAP
jgi:hypothetical protein